MRPVFAGMPSSSSLLSRVAVRSPIIAAGQTIGPRPPGGSRQPSRSARHRENSVHTSGMFSMTSSLGDIFDALRITPTIVLGFEFSRLRIAPGAVLLRKPQFPARAVAVCEVFGGEPQLIRGGVWLAATIDLKLD